MARSLCHVLVTEQRQGIEDRGKRVATLSVRRANRLIGRAVLPQAGQRRTADDVSLVMAISFLRSSVAFWVPLDLLS